MGFIYLKLLLWRLVSQVDFQVNNSNLYDAVINLCHIRYILMPRRVLISYLIKWKECFLLFSLKQYTWLFMFSQLCRFLFTNSLLESISYDLKFSILLGSFSAILCINFLTKERKYSLSLFFPIECCASLAPHCYTHTHTNTNVYICTTMDWEWRISRYYFILDEQSWLFLISLNSSRSF